MTCIGIDPGQSGAIAIIANDGSVNLAHYDKSLYIDSLMAAMLDAKVMCVVEHVGAMPGQGVSSTFKFGVNFGWIQGALDTIGVPYELVRPQKWKKMFSCTSDKNTSIAVAKRLFPHVSLKRTPRCVKDDDGLAEALLMAEYARRIYSN
jgi:hypothetical protein